LTRATLLLLAIFALWLASDPALAANLRRVESVGVAPIQSGTRRAAPRDLAVRAAVARSVESVALDLLPEGWEEIASADGAPEFDPDDPDRAEPEPEPEPEEAAPGDLRPLLAKALGENPFEYTTRFRILEDRGVRTALFTRDPKVESEYVVVVEVLVDSRRVRERLRDAGWIETPAGNLSGSQVRLVLEGLRSFAAYDALRRTLLEELEVRSATPIELSAGRAVLEIDGPYSVAELQEALLERAEEGLRVVPLDQDEQTLTLLVDWTPPPASPAPPADADPTPAD
jgi:hypothetical protein